MAAEAVYTRRKTDTGVEYTVTPAQSSAQYSITAWLLVAVIAGVLVIQIFNTRGVVSVLCAAGAVGVLALGYVRLGGQKAARSQATTMTISKAGMAVGGQSFELDDIVELVLVSPSGQAVNRTGVLVGVGGEGAVGGVAMGAAAGIGAAMAVIDGAVAAQAARSWSIALYRRSLSKPIPLVSHLTEDVGARLLNDMAKTIRAL